MLQFASTEEGYSGLNILPRHSFKQNKNKRETFI